MHHSLNMSKSQRMVMVPEWMAQSMQTKYKAETSPFISGLSEIEQQMTKLLKNKKLAGDRKMMLYNELLQRHAEVMKQKRKESTPSVRIIRDKPATPSPRSNIRFSTPRPRPRPTPRKSRIPIYETPKRKTPIRRRMRLENIPEYDDEDVEEEDDPIIPFATPPYTAATSPYFQKNWKRTPVSKRLSGRWEKY